MQVYFMDNPTCASFEEYEEVSKIVTLGFKEDEITWVVSKLSGSSGLLLEEAIELRNWLVCFGFTSEELRVIVPNLDEWISYSPPLVPISH